MLQEDFSGVRVIKSFVRQNYENNRFREVNEKFRWTSLAPLRTGAFILPAIFLILGCSNALVIWYGGMEVDCRDDERWNVAFTRAFHPRAIWILSFVLPQIISAEASAGRLAGLIRYQSHGDRFTTANSS